jgi:hypothetical protein
MRFASRPRRVLVSLSLALVTAIPAQAACNGSAQSNPRAYLRAVAVVEKLPEFKLWSRRLASGVVFQAPTDRQIVLRGKCYWSVSVSADAPDRWMPWHTFYVGVPGAAVMIEDIDDGNAISLRQWRRSRAGSANPARRNDAD